MLRRLVARLVEIPPVYDAVQVAAGARYTRPLLIRALAHLTKADTVIDIGGGTGRLHPLLPPECRYVCADPDPVKLARFRARGTAGLAVVADGAALPITTGSADLAAAVGILHHLDDETLTAVVSEAARIVRPGGRLIVLEPVAAPDRLIARVLWHYDQGAYPRSFGELKALLETRFATVAVAAPVTLHRYLFWVGEAMP